MRVPLRWLAEHVDLEPGSRGAEVAAALVRVGLEEEGIHTGDVTGPLVVGEVLELVKEPQKNGKTINWCRVDVGPEHNEADLDHAQGSRGIVCGAHNFVVGDHVVVALPGAVLPGGFAIAARKTYGHVSDGMICSSRELGLGDDHDGILVLAQARPGVATVPGQDALALLGLDEETVEVNVTPDRGYCFSVRGLAREYAHGVRRPVAEVFRDPAPAEVAAPVGPGPAVRLEADPPLRGQVGCDRFVARAVRGVDPAAASPAWMTERLRQVGMRPVSLVVDVTNYVMLATGQPMHAYDLGLLGEALVVRRARAGEKLTTLDGVVRDLHAEDLLVTDEGGRAGSTRVLGLAGVMGGADTEVSAGTTDVLLEAAHFSPVSVARTARRHRLPSEAAKRFERGTDPQLCPRAAELATRLLVELGGGRADAAWTDESALAPATVIELPAGFCERVVGVAYSAAEIREALTEIGCAVEGADGAALTVTVPSWRPDLRQKVDLVEEVARLNGYDRVPSVLPPAPAGRGLTAGQRARRSAARGLVEDGFVEVLSYPFVAASVHDAFRLPADDPRRRTVRLVNPLSAEAPLMRTSILDSLVETLRRNVSRGSRDVALVEFGSVTRSVGGAPVPVLGVQDRPGEAELAAVAAGLPEQPLHVAGILAGRRRGPGVTSDGFAATSEAVLWVDAVEAARTVARSVGVGIEVRAGDRAPWHPGRCAEVRTAGGTLVGHAGELHPSVLATLGLPARTAAFELDLDVLLAELGPPVRVAPLSTYPAATQDVALVVPDTVAAAEVEAALRAGAGSLLEDVRLFDLYRGSQVGEGRSSLAFALRFRAPDRTLTAEEASAARDTAVAEAARRTGAVQRA
ncbi:phenylalanine--tRNA ligase subunit beta [Kineococcus gynurae]|uniref:Phenylalanine--tRNA ligase beta subunit n=1 Tax=Kineococcus gynurae TaxID=452979 RepID=A0ABV5LY18_9ACTN